MVGPSRAGDRGAHRRPDGRGDRQCPVLIAVTGADLAEGHSLAARRLLQGSLGFLGLGLVLVGVTLWRKRE